MEKIVVITCFIITFFLVIGMSIFFHEIGHYYAMVKYNVYIEEISIGFGPKLFEKRCEYTNFVIRVGILLGGYVKPHCNISKIKRLTFFQKLCIYSYGIIMNILFAIFLLLLYKSTVTSDICNNSISYFLKICSDLNFDFAILNLIPFIGLTDGAKIAGLLLDKITHKNVKICLLILINILGSIFFLKFMFY